MIANLDSNCNKKSEKGGDLWEIVVYSVFTVDGDKDGNPKIDPGGVLGKK